jgi:hypothetical protein
MTLNQNHIKQDAPFESQNSHFRTYYFLYKITLHILKNQL